MILHLEINPGLYRRLVLAAAALGVSRAKAARLALAQGLVRMAELDEVPAEVGGATDDELERRELGAA